ncbi:MAG: cellulase family glycosylhydrolase [Ignavibacteriaceae bacterium]|nr:cellulase family glycosylhydrolase [Ignavibacteriaceae bacterium]
MKKASKFVSALCFILLVQFNAFGQLDHFITAKADKLMDGDTELRFVSYNIPNLHYIEDYFQFDSSSPWRLPTDFEIRDALRAIKMSGGKVVRIYTLSVRREGESDDIIRHVEGPGKFNEKAFKALDKVLQIANEEGVRVIIPFVDNWYWWGGRTEYAAFRGKTSDEFWTDPQLISDIKVTINFLLNRKNTYTGVLYKDDKAVFGWETGNELQAPLSWQNEIAGYVKSLDKNHLVLMGTLNELLKEDEVSNPNFDVLSTHHYSPVGSAVSNIIKNRELTKGRKPYFVGEYGYVNSNDVKAIVDTVIKNDISGIMIWSMRFHSRNGGFYQHVENYGVGSYRFPGFESGKMYNEKNIMDIMREGAYKIDGKDIPPMPVPEPPVINNIPDVYDISWQGSTGASLYTIQRRKSGSDKWETIADNVSDADVIFRPLYNDITAEYGKSYFYRVSAKNSSGASAFSNEFGPVEVNYKKFIDELEDSSKFAESHGSFEFLKYQDIFKAKEDNSRVKGSKESYIIYRVAEKIDSIKIQAFLTGSNSGFELYASDSLNTLEPGKDIAKLLPAKIETFPPYKNFYGSFNPAVYSCIEFPAHSKYLKIKFTGEAQLSRVEIIYSKIDEQNPDIITAQ